MYLMGWCLEVRARVALTRTRTSRLITPHLSGENLTLGTGQGSLPWGGTRRSVWLSRLTSCAMCGHSAVQAGMTDVRADQT